MVFALNTLVGFACAMGLDMGFNSSHHNDEATVPSVHIHTDDKKHDHHRQLVKNNEEKETPKKDKDGCCNENVLKFQNLDKNLNQNTRTVIDAPASIAILNTFFSIEILKTLAESQLHTARYLFPPPPDILIAIHRFQI